MKQNTNLDWGKQAIHNITTQLVNQAASLSDAMISVQGTKFV